MAALNGLMQMDAARATPILEKVLARRDAGSECLRRKAVFLIAQQDNANAESILLGVARNDPDPEVRSQAVFWLSQVNSPTAVAALDSILRSSKDPELQEKALFALSQQDSPKATQALRSYAMQESAPEDMREKAVFWLGQKGDTSSIGFLRTLYGRTSNADLKEKILFAVSQSDNKSGQAWLLEVAQNPKESIEARKQALFWAAQNGASIASLSKLYGQLQEPGAQGAVDLRAGPEQRPCGGDQVARDRAHRSRQGDAQARDLLARPVQRSARRAGTGIDPDRKQVRPDMTRFITGRSGDSAAVRRAGAGTRAAGVCKAGCHGASQLREPPGRLRRVERQHHHE